MSLSPKPETRGRAMVRSRRKDVRAHRREFDASDSVMDRGVVVTSPVRTWFDLAASLSLPDLVAAGDSALRMGVDLAELASMVRRSGGRRGVRRAREASRLLDGRSRSRPESHLRVAVMSVADLPRFEVNEAVYRDEGGWLAEPDLSLPAAKLALEYQGAEHANVERMRKDITRETDLRHGGWLVLSYGPAEVFGRPWQIGPELRHIIRTRRPDLLDPTLRTRRRTRRVVAQQPEWSHKRRPLGA